MARKSKDQIKEEQNKNEKEITGIFQHVSCFWGIDRVEVTNLSIDSIDNDLLHDQMLLSKSKVKYSAEANPATGRMRYTAIEIKDIGGIKGDALSFGYTIEGYSYCILSMVHGGLNIETVGMDGIRMRLSDIAACLWTNYGIRLCTKVAALDEIEIAFTALFDGRIPIRVRQILVCLFARAERSLITYSKSRKSSINDMDIHTMAIKNTRAENTGKSYVLYDKTAELQAKVTQKEIREDYPLKIYRFEEKLLKSQTIKDLLGTNKVAELRDSDITEHIDKDIVSAMEISYQRFFEQSIQHAKQYFDQWSGKHMPGWQKNLISDIIKDEAEHNTIKVIDEESFLYLGIGGDNGARTQRRFVQACEKLSQNETGFERNPLCRMDGWTVEQFIAHMRIACNTAKLNGLGLHRILSHSYADPISIHLTYGVIPDKVKVLKQLSQGQKDRKDILHGTF